MPKVRARLRRRWEPVQMDRAFEEVVLGKNTIRKAAIKYGVPKSTLHDHVTAKVAHGKPPGPHSVLSDEEEAMLEEWLLQMCRIGYGRSIEELRLAVQRIMKKDGRLNPFRDDKPGYTWVKGFLRRHPKISIRKSEILPTSRAQGCSTKNLDKWFEEFQEFLIEHDLLNQADRIWNADESGFPLVHRSGKVMAPKGVKSVYSISSSSKQQITTLVGISAAGQTIPPMHVFPGQRFHYNPLEGGVPGAYLGRSESGWMDSDLFLGWLKEHFAPSLPPARPVVLLLDGHSSHINLEAAQFASKNGILLYCLPPHSTHALQPCDVGFFKPMKANWYKCVSRYVVEHSGETVNKFTFSRVFKDAWNETLKAETIINSFRASGICPLNRGAISPHKILSTSGIAECDTETTSLAEAADVDPFESSDEEMGVDPETHITLAKLEASLSAEDLQLYQHRFENGYDLDTDSNYNKWKTLKDADNAHQPVLQQQDLHQSQSHSSETPQNMSHNDKRISPVFHEVLTIPTTTVKKPAKKTAKRTLHMPKHMTGTAFLQMMEERKMEKEEEEEEKKRRRIEREQKKKEREAQEEEKKRRKVEREQKRQEREEEKQQKEKERQKKKEIAARKKREKEDEAERKRAERELKKLERERLRSEKDEERSKRKEIAIEKKRKKGMELQRKKAEREKKLLTTSSLCSKCGGTESETNEEWVACDRCNSWWHIRCTDTNTATAQQLSEVDWFCNSCASCIS